MNNPPGLVHIETGGHALSTKITIDGVKPMVKRCTIVIDPLQGENQIKLHMFSRQKNAVYEDGEVQTFYGVSKENYEFVKGLAHHLSQISDGELEHHLRVVPSPLNDEVMSIYNLLNYVREQRKTNEQAPEQP